MTFMSDKVVEKAPRGPLPSIVSPMRVRILHALRERAAMSLMQTSEETGLKQTLPQPPVSRNLRVDHSSAPGEVWNLFPEQRNSLTDFGNSGESSAEMCRQPPELRLAGKVE